MKRCNACDEEFENKFSFCPVDGTPLNDLAAALVSRPTVSEGRLAAALPAPRSLDFRLTLVDTKSLPERLAVELRFVARQLKQDWPHFRKHPIAFSRTKIAELGQAVNRFLSAPNSVTSMAAAVLLVFSIALMLVWLDKRKTGKNQVTNLEDESVEWVAQYIPDPTTPREGIGVGVGSNGRVGINKGKGEGSGPEPRKSTGGGGSGNHDSSPAQKGIVPPPSVIPAPIPKFPPANKLTLPVAGIDIDPALWQRLPGSNYGDPRSNSTTPSNGPGDGGGMGNARGSGIGEGDGPGFGPGEKGNIGGEEKGLGCCGSGGSRGSNPDSDDPDRIYLLKETTARARVLFKPEPQYTEQARKNSITGTVVLRVVFSRSGEVTNIRAVQPLPFGLTERAITAARQIRFQPATRHGQPVNVFMQLEYNFNLY